MRRWFLSYHSPDQALAERLKAALERKDTDAQVFFAPSSLRAGGFWSRALAEEIAQADAFILLVGEKGVGDWQELEYSRRRSNNGLKWAICSVRSEGRSVGFSARPLDAFSSRRRRTAWSSAHGAGRAWC